MKSKWLMTALIMLGLILGVIVGQLLHDPNWVSAGPGAMPESAHAHAKALQIFAFIGFTIFMGALKMLIIPLIASSIIVGVTSVGDFSKLGRIGARTLIYYFATMLIAAIIGLVLVTSIVPGDAMSDALQSQVADDFSEQTEAAKGGLVGVARNLVSQMIPENVFAAMAANQPLSIICFTIFFAIVVTMFGETARPIVDFFNAVFEVFMKMVHIVMLIAPIGVFALLAWTVARIGLGVFSGGIGKYMITVLVGLGIHGLIVIPLVLWIFGRTNPYLFLHQMRQALLTALATDSSSATLPVTLECATEFGGVSKKAAGFVIPLGSTVNMDGTAIYEAVAAVFIAQAAGIDLTLTQLIIVAITATLSAVGAAGIPSAGIVTMVIVLDAVNESLAGSGSSKLIPVNAGIGLIIGVDRILDMVRTTVNVWGDAAGAKIIDRYTD